MQIIGELPDVQILYKDIIIPLQTLGGNDNETARLLFADLVVSITEQEPSARVCVLVWRHECMLADIQWYL